MKYVLLILILVVVAGVLWVRFAPVEPARWHVDPAAATSLPSGSWARACMRSDTTGDDLARLDAIATAAPRTRAVAGSVEEGRITWETRSAVFAFPDYTTAEADGTRLCVLARQRFGRSDLGVNALRLRAWMEGVYGTAAPGIETP